MFICTDCYKEYEAHPGYCECGNDTFTEVPDKPQPTPQPTPQPVPQQHSGKQKKSKKDVVKAPAISTGEKVSWIIFGLCIFLSILAWIFIGWGKNTTSNSSKKPTLIKNTSVPKDIDMLWDSSLPTEAPSATNIDPDKILNTRLATIDSELNAYIIDLANAMINAWDRSNITGNGTTQMEFVVQPDGSLVGKKIFKFSGNKSLDNSVGIIANEFKKFSVPPSSYKQEVIIISFKSTNGSFRAFYPNVKKK